MEKVVETSKGDYGVTKTNKEISSHSKRDMVFLKQGGTECKQNYHKGDTNSHSKPSGIISCIEQ